MIVRPDTAALAASPPATDAGPGAGASFAAGAGTGYYDSKVHAPNENIRIADFIEGVKHIAVLLEEFARV